jgi:hypothetical protein
MKQLQDFVAAVGNGQAPSPDALEAAATAISGMLAFGDYHRRQQLGVGEDVAEAKARNIDAAHRLVRRVLTMLQRPIAGDEHHAVLIGGHELDWLRDLLVGALQDRSKSIDLIPKGNGGPVRRDRQRRRELYAASIRDDAGIGDAVAAEMVARYTAFIDRVDFTPEMVSRDTVNKELLKPGRAALARRRKADR